VERSFATVQALLNTRETVTQMTPKLLVMAGVSALLRSSLRGHHVKFCNPERNQ
jgi:hypothetical protein